MGLASSPLAWRAPVANAPPMPEGWTDAAAVVALAMSDHLGASLPVVLDGVARLELPSARELGWSAVPLDWLASNALARLQAAYWVWCSEWDTRGKPAALDVSTERAAGHLVELPRMVAVWQRCLAIAELPREEVPTFTSILAALRPEWRARTGRDVRIDGPNPRASSSVLLTVAAVLGAWYFYSRR